jgi:hypothetical protein
MSLERYLYPASFLACYLEQALKSISSRLISNSYLILRDRRSAIA